MVRWMREAKIAKGQFMQAAAWAKEVSGYVESKHHGPKIHVFMDVSGAVGIMRWMADYDTMDHLDQTMAKVLADPDYHKLIAKAFKDELFIDGRAHDVITREL